MTHLEFENLASDYLEGQLEASPRAEMEAHLADCGACRELLSGVRQVLDLCGTAETAEPSPWLIAKIMRATVGAQKPAWHQRLADCLRPVLQPRVAYSIAMTVFTFSIIINAAGLNLRSLQLEDLNPRTWLERADRQRHLIMARAEKYYYDLRVVVEIESLRRLSEQPQNQEETAPKPEAPGGGSSQGMPSDQSVASNRGAWVMVADQAVQTLPVAANRTEINGAGRSLIP